MGDDGLGVRVVEELKKRRLPKNVDVVDGGTLSFQLLNFFDEYDKIIIVDAVSFGKKPGRVYRFRLEDILKFMDRRIASIHDFDVFSVVGIVRNFSDVPEVVVIGVEVQSIREGIGLSDAVETSIPKVVKKIMKEIGTTPSRGRTGRLRRRRFRAARRVPTYSSL